MRELARSASFLGALFLAPVVVAAPPDPRPPVGAATTFGELSPQSGTAGCTQPGGCAGQPSAGAPGDSRPAEAGGPTAVDKLCLTLAMAAGANDLPVDFLTRLIWQESRFNPGAVSRAGAQGVAQFMPATASWRGVANPFDPLEAITKSAQLLRDLRREFGNLGLAAAAYNAGPGRVREWLAGRRGLPGETRAYVRIVTGRSAEEWVGTQANTVSVNVAVSMPCQQTVAIFVQPPAGAAHSAAKPILPWGVELVGSSSESGALSAYRQLQKKYSAILAGYEPRVVFHGVVRDMGWARIRVDAESRASAQKLCASLRAAGAGCDVLRN